LSSTCTSGRATGSEDSEALWKDGVPLRAIGEASAWTSAEGAEKTRQAFRDAGRDEEPRIGALAYFGLGENAEEAARRDLTHYYAWMGEEMAGMIASSAATDEETVKGYLQAFEGAGCDEVIFFPTSPDPEQVDLLAKVALS